MHIDPTTHEHGSSGKVYSYEGDFDVGDDAITWNVQISQSVTPHCGFAGSAPLTSTAIAALAEKFVFDTIVKRIDSFADGQGAVVVGAH